MTKNNQKALEALVSECFDCDKRRIDFIIRFLVSLLIMCNVSYSKLALVLNPKALKASNFKRIQRFFKQFTFSFTAYMDFVFKSVKRQGVEDKFVLSMDRTNWKFGKVNINVLMIALVYNGTAIPLIWRLLDKQGNSNISERIFLLRSLRYLTKQTDWLCVSCLVMDREFKGNDWLAYLQSIGLNFVLRVPKSACIKHRGKTCQVWQMFQTDKRCILRKPRTIYGGTFYMSGQRIINTSGQVDYVILVSNISAHRAVTYYEERWGIEVLFGQLKKRGFNFEDTHLTNLKRIQTMLFFLSLAHLWAIKTGEWIVENGRKIPLKNVQGRIVKLYSTFTIGLDQLRADCIHKNDIKHFIDLLSCT